MFGAIYLLGLIKHPPQSHGMRAISFFTESTKLFPSADLFALDFRLDGYSCWAKQWEPIDPRAYFPIQADDKESRFQRFSYFYKSNRESMHALEAYIENLHPGRIDGLFGPIGGIRLSEWTHPIPLPGAEVAEYVYRPLEIPPRTERKVLYHTLESEIRKKCAP